MLRDHRLVHPRATQRLNEMVNIVFVWGYLNLFIMAGHIAAIFNTNHQQEEENTTLDITALKD